MDPQRDRVFGLMSDLCGRQHPLPPDSLRLLSHTLLGLARDDSPRALFAIRDALPWLVAYLEACDGAEPDVVADIVVTSGAVRVLGPTMVERRLATALAPRHGSSRDFASLPARLTRALHELAELDRRLLDAQLLSTRALRDTLLTDSRMLEAAATIVARQATTGVARRFEAALGRVDVDAPARIATLADLETSWDGGATVGAPHLSERSWRFAMAALDHLSHHELLPVLRAALLYGSPAAIGDADLEPPFAELAAALVQMRGVLTDEWSTSKTWNASARWVHYMIAHAAGLAGRLNCSEREARSFAHFSLHIVNFCEMIAADLASEALRDVVMEVENALRRQAEERSQPSREPAPLAL